MNHIEPLNTSKVANCQPEFRECEFFRTAVSVATSRGLSE